jgi:serine phosphatase RsbU (regulator of sigma subunit)
MPTGHDFSRETKQMMFNVIKFVEREKGGCIIPLNNVNDRIHSILGISMTSVERLKREMLEKENELIQLQKKRDQEKQDKEDAAIRATLRLRNPRTRSSSSTSSSSSVTAAFSSITTTFMPIAKSSRKRGQSGRSPILLTENQKENIR